MWAGACYFFDTDYREHEGPYESNIVHSLLIENRAKGNGGGGGIYLDGRSRLNLTDVRFIVNHAGPDPPTRPGRASKVSRSSMRATSRNRRDTPSRAFCSTGRWSSASGAWTPRATSDATPASCRTTCSSPIRTRRP